MERSASVVLLLAVLLAAGCTTTGTTFTWPWQTKSTTPLAELGTTGAAVPPDSQPGLAASSVQRFADVPLPLDVKEDKEATFVYESPTLKVGRLVYTSRAPLNELGQFYLREAPAAGWQLERIKEAGDIQIFFTKPDKRLTVIVRDTGIAKGRRLILEYVPESSGSL
jgi:hypothetical protein